MSSNSLSIPNATSLSPAIGATPGALALDVLSGIHHGVRAPIDAEGCTIGSSPVCDLVLADKDVASEHVQLRFYGKQVAVNAIGGAVLIEGSPALKRGYGCRVKLPITLVVGEAKLRIARNGAAGPMIKRWVPYAAVLAVAIAMVPVVAVQAGISGLLPQRPVSQRDQLMVGSVPMSQSVQSDEEIIHALRERLEQANLGTLALSADGRRIDVSGQLPPDRMNDWRDIQRWFDRSHGGRYVLTSLVSAATVANAPHFVFQAVFFGKNPYVVDARGERRYPGAALPDGWMLKSVENGRIVVVRGGQEFKLTL